MSRCDRLVWTVVALVLCPASLAIAAPADFTGVWARFPDPYGDAPFPDNPPPPGGEPRLREPYATAYAAHQKRKQAADKEGKQLLDASTQCLPEGMPTLMGAVYNIQILQAPNEMVVLAEFLTQTRRIYLNEKMPPADAITASYNGYSVGHWEGDTLVVRTLGVRDDAKFFDVPHTRDMVIMERLRLTAPDRLEDRVKIEDPTVFFMPYEFTYGYKKEPTYKIMEYICDDNHYVPGADGSVSLKVTPNEVTSVASMQRTIDWLYGTALSSAIRDTDWIVPTVQAVHICAITVVVGSALVTELRVAGVIASDESLNVVAQRYLPWMWRALGLLLATGLLMLVGEPERVVGNGTFWIKMILVTLGVMLSVALRRPLLLSAQAGQRQPAKALAWALLILWVAVIFCGRLIAYT